MNSLYSVFEFPVSSFKYNLSKDFEKEAQDTKIPCQMYLPDKEGSFSPEAAVHEGSEILESCWVSLRETAVLNPDCERNPLSSELLSSHY